MTGLLRRITHGRWRHHFEQGDLDQRLASAAGGDEDSPDCCLQPHGRHRAPPCLSVGNGMPATAEQANREERVPSPTCRCLRTPLNGVIGQVPRHHGARDPGDAVRGSTIHDSARHLLAVVETTMLGLT